MESEDESDSDPDYDVKQKPKANKKQRNVAYYATEECNVKIEL